MSPLWQTISTPQPTISRHLRVLRQRALVTTERNGAAVVYRLTDERMIAVLETMRKILRDSLSRQSNVLNIMQEYWDTMKDFKYTWLIGLFGTLFLIVAPIVAFITPNAGATDDPWANVPIRVPPTSHADLMPGPYETGQEVTVACLECHEDAADQVMHTTHWTWKSEPVQLPGRDELVQIGKANQINNFCIGTQGNEPVVHAATSAMAGKTPTSTSTTKKRLTASPATPTPLRTPKDWLEFRLKVLIWQPRRKV